MKCCAVVDTNVLVAALLSKRDDSATVRVIRAMISGEFIPLYHEDILAEYEDVLHRKKKYDLSESAIQTVLNAIRRFGIEVFPKPTGEIFIDEDDIIFYEVAMEKHRSYGSVLFSCPKSERKEARREWQTGSRA